MLVQPARNRAIKQPSTAREIRNDVCLLITGRVLYTNEEAGITFDSSGPVPFIRKWMEMVMACLVNHSGVASLFSAYSSVTVFSNGISFFSYSRSSSRS
jgi:hypothetical protein